jgi:hypothetical protein
VQETTDRVDFAVIVLTRDTFSADAASETQKSGSLWTFRAGILVGSLGADRCFLIYGGEDRDLPVPMSSMVSMRIEEPENLADKLACNKSIAPAAREIAERVRRVGLSQREYCVPTMSPHEVWQRERLRADGGDLEVGEIVVCDTQPTPDEKLIAQVRHNIDKGIRYTYFFSFGRDSIEKVCQALQVIMVPGGSADSIPDFNQRADTIRSEKARILRDMKQICDLGLLRVVFMPSRPQFIFRVHNASSRARAAVYLRYDGDGNTRFIPWARGSAAESLWRSIPVFVQDMPLGQLFHFLKPDGADISLLNSVLERALPLYFPGMVTPVKEMCVGKH